MIVYRLFGEIVYSSSRITASFCQKNPGMAVFLTGKLKEQQKKGEKRKFFLILQETTLQTPLNML